MSQIIVTKPKNSLMQDFVFSNKKFGMNSSANMVICDVCGKGLEDGFSVTAKSILKETMFFCEVHLN